VSRLTLDTEPFIRSFITWDDLYEQVATSVVHLEVSSSGGQNKREDTGFILYSSEIDLTTYHVIAGTDELQVRIAGRQ